MSLSNDTQPASDDSAVIQNGVSEGMTLEDIAEKHGVSIEHIRQQYEIGKQIETEHAGDTSTDEIARDHLAEAADYYSKLVQMEKTNARQFPKTYYAKHMQPGICVYNDETILVDLDDMKRMAPSFVGKPVFIGHQNVDLANLKSQAAGYISDSFYNELDGWMWVKFIAVDDAAHDAIMRGWAVSNAYVPLQWDDRPGTWNNAPYHRQILNGEFTHLAIVPDPRYERACILSPDAFKSYQAEKKEKLNELQNSKESKPMFNLFKTKREAVSADKIDAETMIELPSGKTLTMQELINSADKDEDDKDIMNSEIEVGDEKLLLKDLIERYSEMTAAKKNEAEAAETAADEAKEEKENEAEETAKDEEKEKQNALETEQRADGMKSFIELQNAHMKATEARPVESSLDKLARGKSRYGSDN